MIRENGRITEEFVHKTPTSTLGRNQIKNQWRRNRSIPPDHQSTADREGAKTEPEIKMEISAPEDRGPDTETRTSWFPVPGRTPFASTTTHLLGQKWHSLWTPKLGKTFVIIPSATTDIFSLNIYIFQMILLMTKNKGILFFCFPLKANYKEKQKNHRLMNKLL